MEIDQFKIEKEAAERRISDLIRKEIEYLKELCGADPSEIEIDYIQFQSIGDVAKGLRFSRINLRYTF